MPRSTHGISRKNISQHALKVLYQLHKSGFQAYLVGGCVRDLLLQHHPKDFDVVTDAHPEQLKRLFRNCRLIGRRFRLAHIHFGPDIVEVATFRGKQDENAIHHIKTQEGLIIRDNIYGNIEEDAWRRDFTINALYYNIADFSVVDFVNGVEDLKQKILRIIGDPQTRYREDPVRMLRAVRFAAKLELHIEKQTAAAIQPLAHLLKQISPARLFEETLKLFHSGAAEKVFSLLQQFDLFTQLFPATAHFLINASATEQQFIVNALRNTDQRLRDNKSLNPAFIFAVLLWQPLQARAQQLIAQGKIKSQAFAEAEAIVLREQLHSTSIPKRISLAIRDIWHLQQCLTKRYGNHSLQIIGHKRFRAAYDLLLLRTQIDTDIAKLASWWTTFQEVDEAGKSKMIEAINTQREKRAEKRKKKRTKTSENN